MKLGLEESPELIEERDRLKELLEFRDTEDAKKLAAWVRQCYEQAKTDREKIRTQWIMNYAFYRAKQDLKINGPEYGSLAGRAAKANNKFARVINRVRPAVRAEIATLIAQKPSAIVVPASSEDQDLFAAIAGEQVYESMYRRAQVAKSYVTASMWQVVTGTGYLKAFWDPSKTDYESQVSGDVLVEAPSPFHIFVPDLLEVEIENQPWTLHSYSKPMEWIKTRYRNELAGVTKLKASSKTAGYDYEDQAFKLDGEPKSAQPDSCIIFEVWIKPGAHALFPQGGLITMVEDTLVQVRMDGLPYKHGESPFIKFDNVPVGTFYSDTWVTDIVDLQRDFNKIRAQISESVRKTSRIQMVAQKGAIAPAKWTNETGLIIEYTPGMTPPTPYPVQELPSYVFNELSQILSDIEDISGQHQVSKGSAPPGVTAATAISFLQEKDDAYRVPAYQSTEYGFEKLGRQLLSLAVQFWDTPRLVKVVGNDSAFDVQLLSGADLSTSTDLRIEAGSALPKSRAARTATIMDLMNMGHIPPEEGLKMMEIGGTQNLIENLRQDERQAQRENIRLKNLSPEDVQAFDAEWNMAVMQKNPAVMDKDTGEPLSPPPVISVNTWDNHEVHILIHNKFRKSQAYELLPDEIKNAFEEHVEQHKAVLQADAVNKMFEEIPSDGSEEEGALDIVGMAGEAVEGQAMMEGQEGATEEATQASPEMAQEVM